MLSSHHPALANVIPADYPTAADFCVLGLYREPMISLDVGLCEAHAPVLWRAMDPAKLARFLGGKFSSWGSDYGILSDFGKHIFPGLVLHEFIQQVLQSEGEKKILTPYRLFKDVILNPGPHQTARYKKEMRVKLVVSSTLVQEITGSLSGTYSTPKSTSEVAAFCNPDNQTIIVTIFPFSLSYLSSAYLISSYLRRPSLIYGYWTGLHHDHHVYIGRLQFLYYGSRYSLA
ncbi:hypothetical protein EV421DRAFT_1922781 [Armillaria borealis]|uniref:Uncharacterized protein n=1 Tax=Armillaria borealis TaxID=47425 RepID=A0AA39K9Q2_9AGAR|nr:hypothetical protein EV421DRAFT_1922781 [Armillaria borealis]